MVVENAFGLPQGLLQVPSQEKWHFSYFFARCCCCLLYSTQCMWNKQLTLLPGVEHRKTCSPRAWTSCLSGCTSTWPSVCPWSYRVHSVNCTDRSSVGSELSQSWLTISCKVLKLLANNTVFVTTVTDIMIFLHLLYILLCVKVLLHIMLYLLFSELTL